METTSIAVVNKLPLEENQLADQIFHSAGLDPVVDAAALRQHGAELSDHQSGFVENQMVLHEGQPYIFFEDRDGTWFARLEEGGLVKHRTSLPEGIFLFSLYAWNEELIELFGSMTTDPPTAFEGHDILRWQSFDGGATWGEG